MDDFFGFLYSVAIIGIVLLNFYKKFSGKEGEYKRESVDPYDEPELEPADFEENVDLSDTYESLNEGENLNSDYLEEEERVEASTEDDKIVDDELEMYDDITDYIEDKEDIYDEDLDEKKKSPVPEMNAANIAQGVVMSEILEPPRAKRPHRYFSRK